MKTYSILSWAALLVIHCCIITPPVACAQPAAGKADEQAKQTPQAARELEFAKTLSGATLVGHYTISGKKPDGKLAEEKYTISKVSKLPDKDNTWRFVVRIQYGKFDLNVPLDLEVQWAGDTPTVTLTDFRVPPLGTFSARVLFYRGQYAGTWHHGEVGGHLFGRIDQADTAGEGETPKVP